MGESRAPVEMGNDQDEDEEPWEAVISRVRTNPKNPTNRENEEHKDSGHVVYRCWCAACVEGRGVGRHLQVEPLKEEEREETKSSWVSFDWLFLTPENADTTLETRVNEVWRYPPFLLNVRFWDQ